MPCDVKLFYIKCHILISKVITWSEFEKVSYLQSLILLDNKYSLTCSHFS